MTIIIGHNHDYQRSLFQRYLHDHKTCQGIQQGCGDKVRAEFDNCPKHPSFCTNSWIEADFARGERYFIIEEDSTPIGCVAYENPGAGLAYLNRLSVLPTHRNRGIGARLVQHIIQVAQSASIQTISIGVIGEHDDLQRWYRKLGFKDEQIKHFPHLPFSVKYMSYAIKGRANTQVN